MGDWSQDSCVIGIPWSGSSDLTLVLAQLKCVSFMPAIGFKSATGVPAQD